MKIVCWKNLASYQKLKSLCSKVNNFVHLTYELYEYYSHVVFILCETSTSEENSAAISAINFLCSRCLKLNSCCCFLHQTAFYIVATIIMVFSCKHTAEISHSQNQ